MTELQVHDVLVLTMFVSAALTFVALFFVTAPYGRHLRSGWGFTLPARVGWIVMESPAVLLFAYVYLLGENAMHAVPLTLLGMWQFHYVYRTFIYPLRLPRSAKRMPVSVVAMALLFNGVNAYINARWISQLGTYTEAWFSSPAFVIGATLFLAGWAINQHADLILLRLRGPGENAYKIPRGGLYGKISCPNYFGEMLQWSGWAIATWSTAGLAFAVFSMANLLPRAIANHRWYQREFSDYPPQRKAVIPFLL
jgi:protein-S-isoprenylcysteine O-methyltransferase Ste14